VVHLLGVLTAHLTNVAMFKKGSIPYALPQRAGQVLLVTGIPHPVQQVISHGVVLADKGHIHLTNT
jgi:hypothetical protein